jgi:hypothetical protein
VQDGGAVFLDSSSLLSVHNSVFSGGVADNGGAVRLRFLFLYLQTQESVDLISICLTKT